MTAIFLEEKVVSNNQSSKTIAKMKMRLSDILQFLIYNSISYKFKEVISYRSAKSKLRYI